MKQFKVTKSITNRDNEILNLFLKDVSQIPKISADEEIRLAKLIKQGDKKALNRLVTSNLRFVISVAKQYQGKGLDLMDLISEGCIGMIEAAKRFDETRGFKFISYAVWWIRQSILAAISSTSRTIRLPMSQTSHIVKLLKVINEFEQKNGRKPSNIELSKITGIDSSKIDGILNSEIICSSLDSTFNDEDDNTLIDITPNTDAPETDKTLKQEDKDINLDRLLNVLDERDSDILIMFFGLKGVQPLPYEEIGARFHMTGERARQLCTNAIKLLREKYPNLVKELLYD